MAQVIMNGRVLLVPANGQGRVAAELNRRLGLPVVAPPAALASGPKGHLWEQTVLPLLARGRLLWSPSTSGPILYRRQIVTVHDIGFVDVPQYFSKRFADTYDFIVGRLARTAAHIITVSEFSRQRLIEHYGVTAERCSVIYPGISEAFSLPEPSAIAAVRERYGLGDHPYLVAFAGVDPRKNVKGILAAWARLPVEHREARLVVFGRVSNPRVFGATGVPLDAPGIVAVGGVSDSDLAALYAGSRGLVFPSLYEGFGLPVVEAAASGAPVLTSRVASLPEVAPEDAVLVDPTDIEAIAAGMTQLLEAPADPARRAATATETRQRFSWDAAADTHKALFARF
jgi:glycosyltransferase involved in cell wall biosynthesis